MIIYPGGYGAAEAAAGRPLFRPRILYNNYLKLLTLASVTVSTEAADGPRDMPLRPETDSYWSPTALPATWQVALGSSRSVSAVGIAGHDLFTKASSITVATSNAGGGFTTFATGPHTPANDGQILLLDTPRTVDTVKLTITGTLMPKIPVIYAGDTLTMDKGVQVGFKPPYLNRTSVRTSQVSRGGQYIGQDFYRKGVKGNPSFKMLSETWYRTNFHPFVLATRNYPYFFAWRPDVFTEEVAYAWHERDIEPSYMTPFHVGVDWELVGVGSND